MGCPISAKSRGWRAVAEITACAAAVREAAGTGAVDVSMEALERWVAWALGPAGEIDPIQSNTAISLAAADRLDLWPRPGALTSAAGRFGEFSHAVSTPRAKAG